MLSENCSSENACESEDNVNFCFNNTFLSVKLFKSSDNAVCSPEQLKKY